MSKSVTSKKANSTKPRVTKQVAKKSKSASKKGATKPVVKSAKNIKVVKKQQEPDVEKEEGSKRYFKCIMIDESGDVECGGRYSGKKPKQAGSKAYTRIYKSFLKRDEEVPQQIIFGMHECTRSSKRKKKYFYVGTRVELENPEKVPIHLKDEQGNYILDKKGNKKPKLNGDGKPMVIPYRFNNVVKKLANPETYNEFELLANYDAKEDEQKGGEVKKSVKKSGKKPTKKVAKKTTKPVAKKAAKKGGKKVTKKPNVKKASNIIVKKNTTKGTESKPPTKKAQKKPAKKATKN